MPTATNEIPIQSLSVPEMQRREMLCKNTDLPKDFAQLTTREQACLLAAGTKLFASDSPIFRVQRSLFATIVLVTFCPRLRAYCAALIDLSVEEWDYFAQHYTVWSGGGEKLAAAATAYTALFPTEY